MSEISEKLTCLMKSNLCTLLKVDELDRTFLLISSVFIFVERENVLMISLSEKIDVVKEMKWWNRVQIYCKYVAWQV